MKLERLALFAEIVGGIAIVLSLIFVALEIQQNSESRSQEMTQAVVSSYGDSIRVLTRDEKLRCIYIIGTQDFSRLRGSDQVALSAYFLTLYRQREDLYFLHLAGQINPEVWQGFESMTRNAVQYPGFKQWFAIRRHWFSEPFQTYLEGLMSEGRSSLPFSDSGCSLSE